MTTVREVCNHLKQLAPLNIAEDWDNVGLLLGDELTEIQRVLTCLTLTSDVAAEAVSLGAGLIVTHHPVMFKPVKKITTDNAEGRMLLTLARHNIAVYSPHTAWDNSDSGINQQLAERLELQEIASLRARFEDHVKLVTFVPEAQLQSVREAVWAIGAGTIGNYLNCSFSLPGTGTFFGSEMTNPTIGQPGQLESVAEIRLEIICKTRLLEKAIAALRAAHPYEEPAIDVFAVKSLAKTAGSGRVGNLPQPMKLAELNRIISERLKVTPVQFVGQPSQLVKRVGIACGAAGDFLRDAHRKGCQAFLTGEARFHACLEARDLGMGMILPGHFATERFAMETLAQLLTVHFPQLAVSASETETDPVQTST